MYADLQSNLNDGSPGLCDNAQVKSSTAWTYVDVMQACTNQIIGAEIPAGIRYAYNHARKYGARDRILAGMYACMN